MPEEKSLKDLITKMMESYQLSDRLAEMKVKNDWEQIVGKIIAKNTSRVSVYKRTLYIEVLSAPLKNDLYFHEKILVDKVNQHLGQTIIDKIKIK